MEKIKLATTKEKVVRGLMIQIDPSLYDRMGRTIQDLKITKRILIQTAILKLLDEIEEYGVEL